MLLGRNGRACACRRLRSQGCAGQLGELSRASRAASQQPRAPPDRPMRAWGFTWAMTSFRSCTGSDKALGEG